MPPSFRMLMLVQIALFTFAAGAHAGIGRSETDPAAAIAEAIIALALTAGLVYGLVRPAEARTAALVSQGFALVGTLVGFTLVVTVGPTHAFDVVMHSTMLVALAAGLTLTWRQPLMRPLR